MTLNIYEKSIQIGPRRILNPLLLLLFSALWIRDLFYWFPKDAFGTSLNYWAYTDWLIDYSQGFIRRGLSGEIFRLVPAAIPPIEFVAVLSWVLILAVVAGYIHLLARSRKILHPLTLFGLLFLPSLFMFYLHDHNAIARKEILGYVTVLLHLLIIERLIPVSDGSALPNGIVKHYVWWLLPINVLLLPAVVLIHEGNFLLFIPIHAMITLSVLQMTDRCDFKRAVLWTGLMYLPAALAFGAVYLTGTPGYPILLGICKKWAAAGAIREGSCVLPPDKLSGSTLPGSFIPMQWSLAKAASITQWIITMNWIAWIIILPTLSAMLWYLGRQAVYSILRAHSLDAFSPQLAKRYTRQFFRKFFLIPFLLSLPVYLTAYDYGRWFTVACINFVLVAASVTLPCRECAYLNKGANDKSPAADSQKHLDHRLVFYGVSMAICLLAVVLWLPHYCLFSCEIIRSPFEFLSHTFTAR